MSLISFPQSEEDNQIDPGTGYPQPESEVGNIVKLHTHLQPKVLILI